MTLSAPPCPAGGGASVPALAAEDVWRSFGRERVLRGIALHISAGAGVAILGPNGAGKSTLLRILAGALRPGRGTVRVHGRDPWADPRVRGAVGFVGHEPMLYGGLSAFENVRLFAALYGVPGAATRAAEACDLMGIARRHEPVRALSRGLVQRTALARALAHRPTVLVLDEAFTGLDPEAASGLTGLLREFKGRGGALVLSTHQPAEAVRTADCAYAVVRGRLCGPRVLADADAGALEAWYRTATAGMPVQT